MGTFALQLLKSKWSYFAILTILVLTLFVQHQKDAKEIERVTTNQEALLKQNDEYKTQSGKSAKEVDRLQLTVQELKKYKPGILPTIADLNIKPKRVISVETTEVETNLPIKDAPIKDSIRYRDGIRDTLHCIDLKTPYFTISGCEQGGLFNGLITTITTITQIAHRVPRQFLFIKWGTKGIRQEVTSSNPSSKIIYSEYLEIQK